MKKLFSLFILVTTVILSGCATQKQYDYSSFLQSKPRSILAVMPTDSTNEVKAAPAVLARSLYPLSEAGYYVFPIALVNETFKHNGISQAQEIHNIKLDKLYKIFGADAVLYLDVSEYGVNYQIINSETKVSVSGKLVDLRTGKTLWTGSATASSDEQNNNNSSGLIAALVVAAVKQITNTIRDDGFNIAAIADNKLLETGNNGNILYGPYHHNFGKDPQLGK